MNLRQVVNGGELGLPMGYTFRDDQYWPTGQVVPGHSSWRSDRAQAGGGALLEHSIHAVDIICWIFGPVRRVQAHTRRVFGFEVEDVATVMLEHESGVVGTLLTVFNGVRGREERRIEVFLESGAVEVTTDFIVGAGEDSFLIQRPDREAVRVDLAGAQRGALRAHGNATAGLPLLYVRRGPGVGEGGPKLTDRCHPASRTHGAPIGSWMPLTARRPRALLVYLVTGLFVRSLRRRSGCDAGADPTEVVYPDVERLEASSGQPLRKVDRVDRVVGVVHMEGPRVVVLYAVCRHEGAACFEHPRQLRQDLVLYLVGLNVVEHVKRGSTRERGVCELERCRVAANHDHVRIRQAIAERDREISVDLDGGEAVGPRPQDVGREPWTWADLDHVAAEVDPPQGFGEDQLFDQLAPLRAGAELEVARIHRTILGTGPPNRLSELGFFLGALISNPQELQRSPSAPGRTVRFMLRSVGPRPKSPTSQEGPGSTRGNRAWFGGMRAPGNVCRRVRAATIVSLLGSLGILLAACSSGSANAAGSKSTSTTAAGSTAASFAAYESCLKSHGVTFSGRGFGPGGGGPGSGSPPSGSSTTRTTLSPSERTAFEKASAACASLRPTFSGGGGGRARLSPLTATA